MKIFQISDYEWWYGEWDKPNQVNIANDGEPEEMASWREALDFAMDIGTGAKAALLCGTE